MKYLLCLVGLLPIEAIAQESGIRFERGLNWTELQVKAATEHKYIFIDCFATWCVPCRKMEGEVFNDTSVGNFVNSNFISVRVQMDTTSSDDTQVKSWYSTARVLKDNYRVNAYPCFLFFSPDGRIVHKGMGYRDPGGFVRLTQDAMTPGKQYYTLIERNGMGRLPKDSLQYLGKMAENIGEKDMAYRVNNEYINELTSAELFTADNIMLMYANTRSSTDRGFALFRDSAAKMQELDPVMKEEYSKGRVLTVIYWEEMEPYESSENGGPDWIKMRRNVERFSALGDEAYKEFRPWIIYKVIVEPALEKGATWREALTLIEKQVTGLDDGSIIWNSVAFYGNAILIGKTRDCSNFISCAAYYVDQCASDLKSDDLNTWAWLVFQHSSSHAQIKEAIRWIEISIKLSPAPNPMYFDTYANLLYKDRRTKEAITWEGKAVGLAADLAALNNSTPDRVFSDTLEKMEHGVPTWTAD